MQKNLVKLSYLAQKVLQRGRVPVLQLVDLPSMLTQNNGRKMPIFLTPCILPFHTGFKNIFMTNCIKNWGFKNLKNFNIINNCSQYSFWLKNSIFIVSTTQFIQKRSPIQEEAFTEKNRPILVRSYSRLTKVTPLL